MKLDPRQVRSKEKLHEAYLSLIIEGHDQLSIQQVCQKAEVTRPTFYKLYKDIYELRKDLIEKLLMELKEALTIQNPKPLNVIAKDDMPENLILLFEHIQKNHIAYETLLIYQPDALFINGIQDMLKEYVRDGIYFSQTRPYLINVNEELIVAYVAGAYLESVRWWIKTNYESSAIDMAKTLIELSLNGPYIKRLP
ncbi:TetR/AcrR family transcriptional regulator [Peribacillus sp. NPDC097675]|uniref:TetR/AcrR family transcriptional regulator n=1 Tax=Peribacillus sp. NPDC097675 TaxID=3390618 RepID=UPI003D015825